MHIVKNEKKKMPPELPPGLKEEGFPFLKTSIPAPFLNHISAQDARGNV